MILWLLSWIGYLLPHLLASWAALAIWNKHRNVGYALVSGTLAGTASSLFIAMIYWNETSICEQCARGGY